MIAAPTQDPKVPATTTPAWDSCPWVWARYAAGGMMTSLGMGTTVLSNAISPPMSQYPPWASTDRYQSENWCSNSVNDLIQGLRVDRHLGIRACRRGIALRLARGPLLRELEPQLSFPLFWIDARIVAHGGHGQNGGIAVAEGKIPIDGFGVWLRRVERLAADVERHRLIGPRHEFCGLESGTQTFCHRV